MEANNPILKNILENLQERNSEIQFWEGREAEKLIIEVKNEKF